MVGYYLIKYKIVVVRKARVLLDHNTMAVKDSYFSPPPSNHQFLSSTLALIL
jgi:hypothetical protein